MAEPVDLGIRGAGERDAGQVADPAARSVAADEEPGGHPVGPPRPAHLRADRGVVLAHPGHLVSAADLGAEFTGAFVEHPLKSRLRERHPAQRGLGHVGEVQVQRAERVPGSRAVAAVGDRFEPVRQAAVGQQVQDAAAETVGLRDVPQSRAALQQQRSRPGQAEFGGQHQAGRTGAHDDHVGVGHAPLTSECSVTLAPAVDNDMFRSPFPQVMASVSDCAARPGPCRKPPGALYVDHGGRWVPRRFTIADAASGRWRGRPAGVPGEGPGRAVRPEPRQFPVAARVGVRGPLPRGEGVGKTRGRPVSGPAGPAVSGGVRVRRGPAAGSGCRAWAVRR